MATLFSDNFSTYTPGSTNVTGFVWEFGGSPIVDFGTMTGITSATGFFERLGHGWEIQGGAIHEEGTAVSTSQVNIMHWGVDGANTFPNLEICSFDNADTGTGTTSNNPTYVPIVSFNINADYTISFVALSTVTGASVYPGGVYVVTSTDQAYFPNTWQYFQMNTVFFPVPIAGSTFVGVSGTMAIDGTQVLVGTVTTSELIGQMFTGAASCNQWRYPGRFGYQRFLGDMSGFSGTSILPFGSYTFAATPRHTLVTQAAVEISRKPSQRNLRFTQGVAEISRKPSTRNLRWTQGVVEIIRRGVASGWQVYET